MTTYLFYVRGHGWEEKNAPLNPTDNLPIDLITVGKMGCTMEDEVADTIISQHWSDIEIKDAVTRNRLIYWTHDERDLWWKYRGQPQFERPKVEINMYSTLNKNLCLSGDDSLNNLPKFPNLQNCGICYWDANTGKLQWPIKLTHRETITLSEILDKLRNMLQSDEDIIQLYWTACMDANFWSGTSRAVSFNPAQL